MFCSSLAWSKAPPSEPARACTEPSPHTAVDPGGDRVRIEAGGLDHPGGQLLQVERAAYSIRATFGSCSSGSPIQALSPSGTGHLVGEERAERLAGDPAHELPDQEPEGDAVVDVLGARLPQRLLRLECPDDRIPGARVLERQRSVDDRQAGLVREQPAHRDPVLAVGAELRPVLDHRSVQIELAALGQQVGADRGSALGRGCDGGDGVLVPRSVRLAIGAGRPTGRRRGGRPRRRSTPRRPRRGSPRSSRGTRRRPSPSRPRRVRARLGSLVVLMLVFRPSESRSRQSSGDAGAALGPSGITRPEWAALLDRRRVSRVREALAVRVEARHGRQLQPVVPVGPELGGAVRA